MASYDSDIADTLIMNIKAIGTSLKSDVVDKLLSDFSVLLSSDLLGSQIQTICDALNILVSEFESFASVISENKSSWINVQEKSREYNNTYGRSLTGSSTTNNNYVAVASTTVSSVATTSNDVNTVSKGREVSTKEVEELIEEMDNSTMPILLQKINKLSNGESIVDLLMDESKSNELTIILKKILGEVSTTSVTSDLDCKEIQKKLLEKINTNNVDITTDEGKSEIKKLILEQLESDVSEEAWNKLLYGDNTVKYEAFGNTWYVAKTNQSLNDYLSYIKSNGVRQDADISKYNDTCLAFAGAHCFDLYTGSKTEGDAASQYAHATAFTDFMSDDKQEVLAKVYEEIMNGRPVVIQVNGNQAGTSRHFVTVVGFKEGVVSGSTLKESDLLIVDSYDGILETMDQSNSRFMTSGADCHKNYSGYRLRVLKS